MPDYEFFVSSDAPRPANRAMRSHAMRTALASRQKRLNEPIGQPEAVPGSSTSRQTEELKSVLKGRFRLNEKISAVPRKKKTERPPEHELFPADPTNPPSPDPPPEEEAEPVLQISRLATRSLDPFGVLPVENNWRVDRLIQYCRIMSMCYLTVTAPQLILFPKVLTKFSLNVSKHDTQRPYFNLAMSEPLVMRGTLALSCTVWVLHVPSVDRAVAYEGLYQKTQAIKDINREINRYPFPHVSDAIIVAVANLANVAAMEGSFREGDMHARGLKRLVDSRGGAMAFKDTYHVAQAITWVDLQTASGLGRAPLFPLIHGYMDVHLPAELMAQADEPSLSALISPSDSDPDENEDITSIFRCLRQSVLAKKHNIGGPVPTRRLHNIADLHILRRVEREPTTAEEWRLRTLCLAAHIFLYAGLRLMHRDAPLVGVMVRRLRDALADRGEMAVQAWPRERSRDLLWCLSVGRVVAGGHGLAAWFDVRLRIVVRMVGLRTRAEVEEVLMGYVWNGVYGREVLDRLCGDNIEGNGHVEDLVRGLLAPGTFEG